MPIVIISLATLLASAWLILLGRVAPDDWIAAAYVKVYNDLCKVDELRRKAAVNREKLSRCSGIAYAIMRLFLGGDQEKQINKLTVDSRHLMEGNFRSLSVFAMPGYVLQRKYTAIGRGGLHKAILTRSYELYGKKHATNKAKHMLAMLLSYPIIGISFTLAISSLLLVLSNARVGFGFLGIGTALVLVMVYAIYDELSDRVKKRRAAISKQFPGVISKLALLVTSGMIMDRAWRQTAFSQDSELYQEMRKTSDELANLVSPEIAYGNFIGRCNTKEAAKLASAILQNLSKGNAEIGRLLKDMAREAWQERRHLAKRDAEKANSKLMIPTMMLLIAILVMLMVPIAINFSGI